MATDSTGNSSTNRDEHLHKDPEDCGPGCWYQTWDAVHTARLLIAMRNAVDLDSSVPASWLDRAHHAAECAMARRNEYPKPMVLAAIVFKYSHHD